MEKFGEIVAIFVCSYVIFTFYAIADFWWEIKTGCGGKIGKKMVSIINFLQKSLKKKNISSK